MKRKIVMDDEVFSIVGTDAEDIMPRATFCGTNGWYDSGTGYTVCTTLEYPEFNIILDAGGGFAHLPAGMDLSKPAYLFLSHLHLDHIAGLHALPRYAFGGGLNIMVANGSAAALGVFLDFPFTAPIKVFKKYLGYDIRVVGLPAGRGDLPFGLSTLPVVHTVETLAARIEACGRTVAYVTDTGLCDNAVEIARGADLLIAECSHRPGERNELWPHMAPEEAAELARRAGSGRLVMTHFDANRYPTAESREVAVEVAHRGFTEAIGGYDGMSLEF